MLARTSSVGNWHTDTVIESLSYKVWIAIVYFYLCLNQVIVGNHAHATVIWTLVWWTYNVLRDLHRRPRQCTTLGFYADARSEIVICLVEDIFPLTVLGGGMRSSSIILAWRTGSVSMKGSISTMSWSASLDWWTTWEDCSAEESLKTLFATESYAACTYGRPAPTHTHIPVDLRRKQRRCDKVNNQVSRGLSLHTRMPVHCCTPTLWLGTYYVQISTDLPLLKSHCTPRVHQRKEKKWRFELRPPPTHD